MDQGDELADLVIAAKEAQDIVDNYDENSTEDLGISKKEAEQNALNAQEKVDLYTYQNAMSPAERLAAITDAQTLLHTEGADKLTPFQKF